MKVYTVHYMLCFCDILWYNAYIGTQELALLEVQVVLVVLVEQEAQVVLGQLEVQVEQEVLAALVLLAVLAALEELVVQEVKCLMCNNFDYLQILATNIVTD